MYTKKMTRAAILILSIGGFSTGKMTSYTFWEKPQMLR